jgi:hypothetical protein
MENWHIGRESRVRCLPSKHETLRSNPSATKKKKKNKKAESDVHGGYGGNS